MLPAMATYMSVIIMTTSTYMVTFTHEVTVRTKFALSIECFLNVNIHNNSSIGVIEGKVNE